MIPNITFKEGAHTYNCQGGAEEIENMNTREQTPGLAVYTSEIRLKKMHVEVQAGL